MISRLEIYFFIAIIFSLNFELYSCACARAEYEMENGECCPMCAPGNRVYRHCTEDTSTTCVPCLDSTFIDAPNGLRECFHCTVCDPGQGLRVNIACTRSSNTVCEPLDGHYCIDQHRGGCIVAQKHIKCRPGQYVKHKGTAFKDTECAECSDGTFSNGSLQICQPHSKCEDLGLTEIKPGTLSSDAECGNKIPAGLIAGIIVPLVVTIAVAVIILFLKIKRKTAWHASNNPYFPFKKCCMPSLLYFTCNLNILLKCGFRPCFSISCCSRNCIRGIYNIQHNDTCGDNRKGL